MIKTIYMTVADYWLEKKEDFWAFYEKPAFFFSLFEQKVLPSLGTIRISDITLSDLERLMRTMREKGCRTTDRIMVAGMLRKLFHMAVQERLIRENPVDLLKLPPTTYGEVRMLSEEQERNLLTAFQKTSQPELFALSLTTGIHSTELLRCRVCDFSEDGKTLSLNQTVCRDRKNQRRRERRTIPLTEASVQILKQAIKKRVSPDAQSSDSRDERLIFTGKDDKPLTGFPHEDLKYLRRETGIRGGIASKIGNNYGVRAMHGGANPKALNRYLGYRTGFNIARFAHACRMEGDSAEIMETQMLKMMEG